MGDQCANENDEREVRFCVNNPRTLAERNALIEAGHECVGCLGNCARCFENRFLEIDEEFVEGESYAQILRAAGLPAARADADARPEKPDTDASAEPA